MAAYWWLKTFFLGISGTYTKHSQCLKVCRIVECNLGNRFLLLCFSATLVEIEFSVPLTTILLANHLIRGKFHWGHLTEMTIENLGFISLLTSLRYFWKGCPTISFHISFFNWFMGISNICLECHDFETLLKTCWNQTLSCRSHKWSQRSISTFLIKYL